MNQAIKDMIYSLGTSRHINFMAFLGGMSDTEKRVLQMMHEGRTDLYIQTELCLNKDSFKQIEEIMRRKLTLAVFNCIDYRIDNYFSTDNDVFGNATNK